MAGRGPAPKPAAQRRRRNADPVPEIQVVPDQVRRGPELPAELVEWPKATLDWWDTWRVSAQAQTFTDTDWDFLLDTALLHAELWTDNTSVAAELRLRVAKFGATPEDRARLKLTVGEPEKAAAKPAARKQASRRGHLLKVVADGEGR